MTYKSAMDDPSRITKSKAAGALFGLTPRKYQSGEKDITGGITRAGDEMVRTVLYEAANALLVRQRSIKAVDATLGWLVDYLSPAAVLVVWVDSQKPTGKQNLHSALERRGFRVEAGTVHEYGLAISARRLQATPMSKAA